MGELVEIGAFVKVAGPSGLFVWLLLKLLNRGDDVQRRNMEVLVMQRDNAIERADECERTLRAEREVHRVREDWLRTELADCRNVTTSEIVLPDG